MTITFNSNIRNCARCGKNHTQLQFQEFKQPVKDKDGDWNYWAICPSSLDPILLRTQEKEDDTNSL